MNSTERTTVMQRWTTVQHELIPQLWTEVGSLTPKLEKLIHILEWVRIEEFVEPSWSGIGRPPHDRGALANAFIAKAVLGLATTAALIERLQIDRALRRIGHVPLIDHNLRGGEKQQFSPDEAARNCERTQAERTNSRIKDDFGGRYIRVKGHLKVMSHLMFGILALSADQWMRLRI
jgi:hypothetical protein